MAKHPVAPDKSEKEELSIEEVYDKTALSGPMLVVKDHIEDCYKVYGSQKTFWKIYSSLSLERRCFSEVVFNDLPQYPRIHINFASPSTFPGTKLVGIIREILDGMLKLFLTNYGDNENIPRALNDFVVMDDCGRDDEGLYVYSFHIQSITSFFFADYTETKKFTELLIKSLPRDIGLFVLRLPDEPFHFVRIVDSASPDQKRHKRISPYSQFLGTNVDVNKRRLFIKKFPLDTCSSVASDSYTTASGDFPCDIKSESFSNATSFSPLLTNSTRGDSVIHNDCNSSNVDVPIPGGQTNTAPAVNGSIKRDAVGSQKAVDQNSHQEAVTVSDYVSVSNTEIANIFVTTASIEKSCCLRDDSCSVYTALYLMAGMMAVREKIRQAIVLLSNSFVCSCFVEQAMNKNTHQVQQARHFDLFQGGKCDEFSLWYSKRLRRKFPPWIFSTLYSNVKHWNVKHWNDPEGFHWVPHRSRFRLHDNVDETFTICSLYTIVVLKMAYVISSPAFNLYVSIQVLQEKRSPPGGGAQRPSPKDNIRHVIRVKEMHTYAT
ncbi:hypothetical protein RhiirA5_381123 [Rhizophagus irregularis]|uniref:Uncharacterized protein n=1 Tax=Rhizophagus irregularis TaxID=588596 RepID=A0A2N0P5X9_9GLOM|nr:hypothetical protein RhiirA5_381123 [Rhizophagus irregularis]